MDPIHSAIKLKHLLILHNKVCDQMQELDHHITLISRRLLLSDLDPQRTDTTIDYLHLSIANGVRCMLNKVKYELLTKVRRLSNLVISNLQQASANHTTIITEHFNSSVTMDTAAEQYTSLTQMCFRNE